MLAFLFAAALAASNPCPAVFANGLPPAAQSVEEVCFTGFAVGYSKVWGEPAWSAEEITSDSARAGEAAKRNGSFHECALPDGTASVSPKDYARTGFDLGHATPAGDRGADKPETFCTANMMPQRPNLNRKVWAGIEASLRDMATNAAADLYVVTGPQIPADPMAIGPDRVAVPIATWKAIWVVGVGAAAWSCTNTDMPDCEQESVEALAVQIGFDPFPGVPAEVKAVAVMLPAPTKGAP